MSWLALVIALAGIYGALLAWASHYNAQYSNNLWWALTWAIGCLVPWAHISRFSTNLLLDGLAYDVALMISFYLTLATMNGKWLTTGQTISSIACIISLIAFKITSD